MIVDLEDVKQWLAVNGGGSLPTDVLARAHAAAERYVSARCRIPDEVPDDLVLAVCLQTARYLARRNSPAGLIGIDDLAVAQIPGNDADVLRLMAPHRKVVFG